MTRLNVLLANLTKPDENRSQAGYALKQLLATQPKEIDAAIAADTTRATDTGLILFHSWSADLTGSGTTMNGIVRNEIRRVIREEGAKLNPSLLCGLAIARAWHWMPEWISQPSEQDSAIRALGILAHRNGSVQIAEALAVGAPIEFLDNVIRSVLASGSGMTTNVVEATASWLSFVVALGRTVNHHPSLRKTHPVADPLLSDVATVGIGTEFLEDHSGLRFGDFFARVLLHVHLAETQVPQIGAMCANALTQSSDEMVTDAVGQVLDAAAKDLSSDLLESLVNAMWRNTHAGISDVVARLLLSTLKVRS
jgi:hypothetical protein